jgi:triacylglycerol lipase
MGPVSEQTTFILDGIWGRPRRFLPLCRMIEEAGGRAILHNYECSGRTPFETLAEGLVDAIHKTGGPVSLVTFSMGGIVARAARLIDPGLPITRAVFINTPHNGSWLACALPFAGVRQLRPNSPLMARLKDADWPIPTLAVWCPGDLVVIPGSSAKWNLACEHIRCDVPLHPWAVWSRSIRRRVVEFLRR